METVLRAPSHSVQTERYGIFSPQFSTRGTETTPETAFNNDQKQMPQQHARDAVPPQTEASDEELFTLIRDSGDQAAFNILYARYDKRLYAYCLRATGSREAAQDAFQAVMSVVFEKRETFTGGNYAAWLFTIARHHVMKAGKRASRTVAMDTNDDAISATGKAGVSDEAQEDFMLKQSLDRAIERLPEDLREAFEMKYRDGLRHEEIAETLGISLSLTKVRVFRAKQLLRASLASFFEEAQ